MRAAPWLRLPWHLCRGLTSLLLLRAQPYRGPCTVEEGGELLRAGAHLLVCGGEPLRDVLGARLSLLLPPSGLAFFSSGHCQSLPELLSLAELDAEEARRLEAVAVLDREALDTVANFTSFLRHLESSAVRAKGTVDVVVLTSDYHARRVRCIAALLLAARGLSFQVAQALLG